MGHLSVGRAQQETRNAWKSPRGAEVAEIEVEFQEIENGMERMDIGAVDGEGGRCAQQQEYD
jgi:hypothetical protein